MKPSNLQTLPLWCYLTWKLNGKVNHCKRTILELEPQLKSSGSLQNDVLLHNPAFSFNCYSASMFTHLPTLCLTSFLFFSPSLQPRVLAQCFLLWNLWQPWYLALSSSFHAWWRWASLQHQPHWAGLPVCLPAWWNEIREDMMAQSSSPHPQTDCISRA